jgi:hypothetical protein
VKKAATILLMSILAFNWLGYRLLSSYLEHSSTLAIEHRIDRQDYEESSLIELRVPLNAPYLGEGSGEFERVSGEIEIDGVHYNYVKRKVEHGELVLMCIPNEGKTRILNSRADYLKMLNDVNQPGDNKNKNTASFKSLTTEYRQENNSWIIPTLNLVTIQSLAAGSTLIFDGFSDIPEQPPRAC